MLKRFDVTLRSNPSCAKPVDNLEEQDFAYYDKDGFELNLAERKFYSAMGFPIHHSILNHACWQEPWFRLERNDLDLFLDHSMVLHRCNYTAGALDQLQEIAIKQPLAQQLIDTVPKWGFDFDLNARASDGTIYEVIHIEYDNRDYDVFKTKMLHFDYTVRHTNWVKVALDIWEQREHWQNLKGFDQNHWKAKHILNWNRAEYLEKAN